MNMDEEFFKRVTFDQEDREYHTSLYDKVKELASEMEARLPDGAEKTLAFRRFQEGLMYAGCALSRHEKYKTK